MKEYFYINRLQDKSKYINQLHYELDRRIYSYGNQQRLSFEKKIWKIYAYYAFLLNLFIYIYINLTKRNNIISKSDLNIMSTAYHGFDNIFKKYNFKNISTPWVPSYKKRKLSFKNFLILSKFNIRLLTVNFNVLISDSFSKEIEIVKLILSNYLIENNINAVFLPQDVGFFEKIIIEEAKSHFIPTFIVPHGTALRYGNAINDNRTDYICVFGQKFKDCLIGSGFDNKKIIITGHPKYSFTKIPNNLNFGLKNILVLTKPMPGQPLETQDILKGRSRDTNRLKDRGNLILYLLDIQSVLIKYGIRKVKLRVHPSESSEWYLKYIDTIFFEIDTELLYDSLNKSSLVLGPTSSMFFDAIYSGVNYLIYEPLYDDGLDILNDPIGSPFDGSDEGIPVAKDINDLCNLLSVKKSVNLSSIPKFIEPDFNLQEIVNIVTNKSIPISYFKLVESNNDKYKKNK